MKQKIRLLSEQTINQIAAGEVIENPASVVKELIENSLDAKSDQIVIEILAGGFHLIKVADNGEGMGEDDALLSIERHATSKIRTGDDLFSIYTMGFRGEALASIASISKLFLVTNATDQAQNGIEIKAEGGKLISCKPCSRLKGTTIEVKSLFYTTPARKKFQKTPPQSAGQIHRTLVGLALGRPDVAFKFISNDQIVFDLKKETLPQRIQHLLSQEFFADLKPFSFKGEHVDLSGYISIPGKDRPNKSSQHLYVNKRGVVSNVIGSAISEGYGTMLGIRRYPFFVLNLAVAPHLIDVNVHPQKKEIRLFDDDFLRQKIKEEISKDFNAYCFAQKPANLKPHFSEHSFPQVTSIEEKGFSIDQQSKQEYLFTPSVAPKVLDIKLIGLYKNFALIDAEQAQELITLEGCDFSSSILYFDVEKGLQRILFDDFMQENRDLSCNLQHLLFPIKVNFAHKEAEILDENLDLIESVGIKMHRVSKESFAIEGLEKGIDEDDARELLFLLLDDLQKGNPSVSRKKENLALKVSSYVNVSENNMTIEGVKILLTKLLKSTNPYLSPLGKKIFGYLTIE